MKFKEFFKNFYVSIKESVSRFSVAFVCTLLLFLTVSFQIVFESIADETIFQLCMTYALTAVLSVLLKTVQEYICEKLNNSIQYTICAAAAIAGFVLINIYYNSLYTFMAYIGIMVALVCFIFYTLMRGENRDLAFPKLVTSWIFTEAICIVLSIGLSTCIAAFQLLIITWDDIYKLYLIILLFVNAVCFTNIFLSFIPKKDIPVQKSKVLRAFVLFAGLPLYMLLLAILLVYLAKIVITRNMPVGEINWFASFASLFFIFFLFSVIQYTEKIAKLFVKFGGYFLAPVLIIQAVAVFERINAYGLTTPRTVSLVLIIISIFFIAGSIIAPKHLNKIALILGIIVLIVTVTPLNVIDMPVKSQTMILKNILVANDMIKDGKVVPNNNVSDEDAKRIISAYEYLKYNADKVPDFIPDSTKSRQEIFGFPNDYDSEGNSYVYCNFSTKESVDISEYDEMLQVHENGDDTVIIDHNDKQYDIDLKSLARSFYAQYGTENNDLDIYKVDENISLYFTNFSFNIYNDDIRYCYFNGYALLKN